MGSVPGYAAANWFPFTPPFTYKKCCEKGGSGRLSGLYDDFGDVHKSDFKEWWTTNERGALLFAERIVDFNVKVINSSDEFQSGDLLMNVQIPLNLPKRFILREFNKLLKKHRQGKRGVRINKSSTALYSITGHVDTAALQKCLQVFDMKIQNPNLKLWQLAQKCRLSTQANRLKNDDTETPYEITNKRRNLASAADKVLRRAAKIIAGTSAGVFPAVK